MTAARARTVAAYSGHEIVAQEVAIISDETGRKAHSAPDWFRFFASDFLRSTRGLRPVVVGIYVTILAELHQRGEPLKPDMPRIARLCGGAPVRAVEQAISDLISDGLLCMKSGGFWSPLIEEELGNYARKSQANTKNVSQRWQKNEQNQSRKNTDVHKIVDREIEGGPSGRHSNPSSSSMIEEESSSTLKGSDNPSEGARPPGSPSVEQLSSHCVDDEGETYDFVRISHDGKAIVRSFRTGTSYTADIDRRTNKVANLIWFGEDADAPF